MGERKVTIRANGTADPDPCSIAQGEKITFKPETNDVTVDITFVHASPVVEWRSKKEAKGTPAKGTINMCVQLGDSFEYAIGPTTFKSKRLRSGPELIVDGGLLRKLVSKQRTTGARKKQAKKR